MVSDRRTSSVTSADATHRRSTSAPYFLMISSGSMELPSDLCMARPSASRVQPWVAQPQYGAAPRKATPISSELWNHPRYWSPPSRYKSAGQGRLFAGVSRDRGLEPELNHTAGMYDSFVNATAPHLGDLGPAVSRHAAAREYPKSTR